MNQLVKGIKSFMQEDEGVTMIEYGLLASLIAVACILAITAIGTDLNAVFGKVSAALK